MPSREELKRLACQEIDARAEEIIRIAKTVLGTPEPGFREARTSRFVAERFRELGIPFREGLALTGVKGELAGGSKGPTVAVLGELDSLIVPDHPFADPDTGAAHACGHHAQMGMLLGVAYGLLAPGVLPSLSGRVVLFAVPAEEYIEIEYREELKRQGKVEFLGGKPELIRLGEFDDIDIAMMCHTTSEPKERKLALGGTNNGTVAKQVQFIGRSAHAGGMPHRGINALNAAMIALMAIHSNRETFRDEDTIRVHPIITKGGEAVNIVPSDVRMETFVRGSSIDAIVEANRKVDRALRAGAMAIGARVRIKTIPGYLPIRNDQELGALFKANAVALVGEEGVAQIGHRTGSTDMGDVSQLIPAIHPYAGGAKGISHGADYVVEDYQLAVINPAKAMAMTVIDLLADGAAGAGRVLARHRPAMTKNDYLRFMRSLAQEKVYEE
jgi:amidohydrolase